MPLLPLVVLLFALPSLRGAGGDGVAPGVWLGGLGSLDGPTLSWRRISATLAGDGAALTGTVATPDGDLPVVGACEAGEVNLEIDKDGTPVFVSGRVVDGVLVATWQEGASSLDLQLVRVEASADARACTGAYVLPSGERLLVLVGDRRANFLDVATGALRTLWSRGDDTWISGERLNVPWPIERVVRFARGASGEVESLSLTMGGEERVARARPRPRAEELTFPSFDGTQIAGTLLIPPGEGPHPAFVWVHGSGPVTRDSADLWPYAFADLGYAVLAVDKRGVGRSGGSYTLPDGSRDNPAHMERRARDVRAALAALRARPDVDGERIGLVGVSQAGWVIPLAAEAGGVAAAIVLSGGLTPVSVEGVFSAVAGEDGSSADAKPIEECLARARAHRPTDRDFRGALEALACPALWLYGDLDRSNPTELCVELIESVRAAHGKDFTVRRFPKAGHSLLTARYGGGAETGTLSAYDPSLHVTLEEWLAAKLPARR